MLPNGTAITPLLGTAEILVGGNGSNERLPLTVPDGTTVLDAKSSPDGTVLGVTVGAGENLFERSDTILVLDAATLERRGSIDTGRAIDAHAWGVGDGAVAVAEGASLSVWTLDGVVAGGGLLEVPITSIDPAHGGFVTSGRDGQIVMWADGSWTPTTIDPGGVTLRHVDLGSSGALVTTVDFYGEITTTKIGDQMVSNSDEQFAVGESMGVAIGTDRSVAASFTSGRVVVLDQDFVELWSFQAAASNRRVDAVAINPETGTLATGLAERLGDLAFDDTVTSWDVARRAALFSHGGEGEDVGGCSFFNARVRFTPDGALMATASHDFSITVADATTGATLHELSGPSTILDLQFSPDGESMVASYDDATVNVWDTSDFALVSTYRSAGAYFAFGVLPDGETMVVVDILGAVSIVDVLDGSTVTTLGGGTYRTSALAISPDGALVAVPTADGTIAFWSTVTGNQLVTDARHAAPVTDLAFGPDGAWLVSSSRDGTVRSWRVAAPG